VGADDAAGRVLRDGRPQQRRISADAREQVTQAPATELPNGQVEQPPDEADPERQNDSFGAPAEQIRLDAEQDRVGDEEADEEQECSRQRPVLRDGVEHRPYRERLDEAGGGTGDRAAERDRERTPVRTRVGPERPPQTPRRGG
jgi:hypothetical protein